MNGRYSHCYEIGWGYHIGVAAASDRKPSSPVSYPVNRPGGQAVLVCGATTRAQAVASLERHGFGCVAVDDPYAAFTRLCQKPGDRGAVILSLAGVYREELPFIASVKKHFPAVEVWLIHTDGRQALLAQAMSLGADGLVAEDGLHRIAIAAEPSPMPSEGNAGGAVAGTGVSLQTAAPSNAVKPQQAEPPLPGEPILTADELRALLHDHPGGSGDMA